MKIRQNMPAMHTLNQLSKAQKDMSKSLQRLASGLRINSASDGAAELAISEKMKAQIRGLEQAGRNIQTGISLVQTAEGALSEVTSLLQRGRELAVQAANGTNTLDDKQSIQDEIDQIRKEIDSIHNKTNFNTISLLSKSSIGSALDAAKQEVIYNLQRGWLAAAEKLVEDTYGINGEGKDFTVKLVDSLDGPGGVLAQVSATHFVVPPPYTGDNITLEIDMSDFMSPSWPDGGSPPQYADRIIAHEMTHAVMDASIDIATGMETWFMEGTAEAVQGADERLSISLNSLGGGIPANGAQALANLIGGPWGGTSDEYSMGFAAVRYMDHLIKSNGGTGVNEITAYMAANTDKTLDDAIQANTHWGASGVSDLASFKAKFTDSAAGGGVDYIKTTLIPELADTDTGSLLGSDASGGPVKTASTVVDETPYGTPTTTPLQHFNVIWPTLSIGTSPLKIHLGPNSGQELSVYLVDSGTSALGISDIDVVSDADSAITLFDSAINQVSGYRSNFGAIQNRLEHALNVTQISDENLTSSESRIVDTDMAKEMTEFMKNSILSQSAEAMLTQANSLSQYVLKLVS